jgi:hypothetical protein
MTDQICALERRVSDLERQVYELVAQLLDAHAVLLSMQGSLIQSGTLDPQQFQQLLGEMKAKQEKVREALRSAKSDWLLAALALFEGPTQ